MLLLILIHDFAAVVEDSPVRTHLIDYRAPSDAPDQPGPLLASCVTDVLHDGLSLVYSFFDPAPEHRRRSLGGFMILDHIAMAREAGLPFVYLGYWVQGSPKMHYKIEYQPSEVLIDNEWTVFSAEHDTTPPPEEERSGAEDDDEDDDALE